MVSPKGKPLDPTPHQRDKHLLVSEEAQEDVMIKILVRLELAPGQFINAHRGPDDSQAV